MAALEGLTRSTRCEGLESAWQGLVAARDGKHPSPNPWQVHKAGCVGSTALHEETGLQPGMLLLQTRSGNETWGLNTLGRLGMKSKIVLQGSYLGIKVIIFF